MFDRTLADQVRRQCHDSDRMFDWATDLFPICRSITGAGVRQTLTYLSKLLPSLNVVSVPSGTPVFDWLVPDEWNIRDAYVADMNGQRVVDFRANNLHVVGYSIPVDVEMSLAELDRHLYSLPDNPDAIPYVTTYYERTWGFCVTQRVRERLQNGRYRVVIDSTLTPGVLNYGELILPGRCESEVLLSTYVCHPSLANNEISGPVVTTALARWLAARATREHTYRILFLPETIGALAYLSSHLDEMRAHTIAGFVVTCVGDERAWSFLPTRWGDTLSDRVARNVLHDHGISYREYSYLDRGSDERQYCSPGVALPVASIMRSKYGTYPEYHTSLDNLALISQRGLEDAFGVLRDCLDVLERNAHFCTRQPGEPQLGRRGLYPVHRIGDLPKNARLMRDIVAYADGTKDIVELADVIGIGALRCADAAEHLEAVGVLERRPTVPRPDA